MGRELYSDVVVELLTWYRSFIGQIISFIMLGFALYGLAHMYQLASSEPIIKHTKKCKYCRQRINDKVRQR